MTDPQARSPQDRRTPWVLVAFFGGVVLLGALLAPWLWWGGQALAAQPWVAGHDFLHGNLAKSEFDRYFRRAVLVAALLLFWPTWRALGVRREDWRLPRRQGGWKELLLGFGLASSVLLLLGWLEVSLGAYSWRSGELKWGALPGAIGTGLAVGVLEEFVFRALLLGLLLRALKPLPAAVALTLLFALLHFFVPPESLMLVPAGHLKLARGGESDLPGGSVSWWTGLWLTGITLGNFGDLHWWKLLAAEFGTLLAVGAVLAAARLRTGALWLSVGLHAGWVAGLKWFAASTQGSESLQRDEWLPWIGQNLKVGLLPLLVVLLTGWLALRLAPFLGVRSAGDAASAGGLTGRRGNSTG